MHWRSLHQSLLRDLNQIVPERSVVGMMSALQAWLLVNERAFDRALWARYGLDWFASADLAAYPIEQSALQVEEELTQLAKVPPVSMETLAMRIRDIWWSGVTIESRTSCPRCGCADMRVLWDKERQQLVLACDSCSWAQFSDKKPWTPGGSLLPARRDQIIGSSTAT